MDSLAVETHIRELRRPWYGSYHHSDRYSIISNLKNMRKLIILICALLAGGALYALVPALFPDTPRFPRTPTSDGTVGWVLEKIVGGIISDATDGTVANTAKLDGTTATGYLKNTDCDIQGKKWIGIDSDWKALCGSVNPILADYGTVSEQGCPANIYHATGTNGTTNTGDTLKSWDIVKTGACGLTIAFADLSILRLDADTTVSLDVLAPAAPSTQTIASAILSNGSLWWRILTDTGSYSIGTDKIVAGVRGTSIAVSSTGNTVAINPASPSSGKAWTINTTLGSTDTEVAIVDSTNMTPDNPSATVYCRDPNSLAQILSPMSPENTYRIPPTGCTNTPAISPDSAPTLYSRSPWIRRNTQKDLSYMYRLMSNPPIGMVTTRLSKIAQELTLSSPPDNPMSPETQNICEVWNRWWTSRYGCQDKNLYAIADYTLTPAPGLTGPTIVQDNATLLYSGSSNLSPLMAGGNFARNTNGLEVTLSGQYIQYQDSLFISQLAGRTITIEVAPPPSASSSVPPGVLLDLWSVCKISWKKTTQQWSNWGGLCLIITNTPTKLITQMPPTGLMQFYIGNQLNGLLPIWTTIKNITIQ